MDHKTHGRPSLVEFLRASPLVGVPMALERDRSPCREEANLEDEEPGLPPEEDGKSPA